MKFSSRKLAVLAATLAAASAQTCDLACPDKETCYADSTKAMDCLLSIPLNETWALNNINVFSQSLNDFGFLALYHATGPPYQINLDIMGELSKTADMVTNGDFGTTDLYHQEHIQSIFQATLDAHTRYQKPVCYNAVFVMPVAFDIRVEESPETAPKSEPDVYFMSSVYADQYAQTYPNAPALADLVGKKIILINGVEAITEISQWSKYHDTRSNNRGIRFNSAVRTYLYRSAISSNIYPLNDLTVEFDDGTAVTLPWLAQYSKGLADVSYCAAIHEEQEFEPESFTAEASLSTPKTAVSSIVPKNAVEESKKATKTVSHRQRLSPFSQLPDEETPIQILSAKKLTETRTDREVIIPANSPTYVSCFTQFMPKNDENAATAGVQKVLVMKVASFSPPGEDYLEAWTGFLDDAQRCLSTSFDLIVVDVMQNGGGYVCLGLRLIELLVEEYENDHTKVQMRYDLPHSPLMDRYIEVVNDNQPYPDPKAVEQILNPATQESYVDGRAYYYPGRNVTMGGKMSWRSNIFALDCREAEALPANNWRPPRFMPPEKLIILTDGTCGSTCASFTKIPQEAGKATFVGAGGLWKQSMDVSSFAGGFVCNPDYLQNIAKWSGTTFPKFMTNQRWQFGWAAWYSTVSPTRPTQFTSMDPDYRTPFWGFPHVSVNAETTTAMVSTLYDNVIVSTVARLAAAVPEDKDCDDNNHIGLKVAVIIFAVAFAGMCVAYYMLYRKSKSTKYGPLDEALMA